MAPNNKESPHNQALLGDFILSTVDSRYLELAYLE